MKRFQITLAASISLILLFGLIVFDRTGAAVASTDLIPEFTAEQYTDSDKLLKRDGTESEKTIQDFAEDIKNSKAGTQVSELSEVVPHVYLNTSDENHVFQYYGNEYGFCMEKNDDVFSLLLVDFEYDGDRGRTTLPPMPAIKINSILQREFKRSGKFGNYTFKLEPKRSDYNLFVANPRFLTIMFNENMLNFGDLGYSKLKDEGDIFVQGLISYGNTVQRTESGKLREKKSFLGEATYGNLNERSNNISECPSNNYNVLQLMKDFGKNREDYNLPYDQIISSGGDYTITSLPAPSAQKENSKIDTYFRVLGFCPKEEIFLTGERPWALSEFLNSGSGSVHAKRFVRVCEFDIVRQKKNSFQYLAGNWEKHNAPSVSFRLEQTVEALQEGKSVLSQEDFAGNWIPVYVLPGGEHEFRFKPKYSGKYVFEMPDYADLYVDGNKADRIRSECKVYLSENTEYRLTVRGELNIEKINSYMKCRIAELSEQTVNVKGNSNHILQYKPTDRGCQKLMVDQTNCKIQVLDEDFQIIQSSDSNTVFANFNPDKNYYFVISNLLHSAAECTVQIQAPNSVALGDIFYLWPDNQTVSFTNTSLSDNYYKMSVPIVNVAVQNEYGNNIANCMIDGANYIYEFALAAGKKCFISFPVSDPNISVEIKVLI